MITTHPETGRASLRPAQYVLRQVALALVLIVVPVAGFTAVELTIGRPASAPVAETEAPAAPLGDLSALIAIANDVASFVDKGDLAGAEKRATDIETAWDEAQPKLQPMNPEAWGNVDAAADALFHALRAKTPDANKAKAAIAGLLATLASPLGAAGGTSSAGVGMVSGIAVTDANGHALPCEQLIAQLRTGLAAATVPADRIATAKEALDKALERCNADDDTHSNALSAAGLAALAQK